MLRVDERRSRSMHLNPDKGGPEIRYDIAPSVPLIARDSYVAETASKMEQLQATMRLMSRDITQLAAKVGDLHEAAEQDQRWQTFQRSEKRCKETKLDELLRGTRDLKARLDRIETCSKGNFHAYNSFEAISRKFAELETFRDEARHIERTLTLKTWLLCGAIGAAALVIVLANALAH